MATAKITSHRAERGTRKRTDPSYDTVIGPRGHQSKSAVSAAKQRSKRQVAAAPVSGLDKYHAKIVHVRLGRAAQNEIVGRAKEACRVVVLQKGDRIEVFRVSAC